MYPKTLALLLVASLMLSACDSKETQTEDTTTTTTTTTTATTAPVDTPTAEAGTAAGSAMVIPAEWKRIESTDQGVAFAHPPGFEVLNNDLKAGAKEPIYIAGDDNMIIAIMTAPNTPEMTSKAEAETIFKALVKEFKLTDVEQDPATESKDVDGFATWTDIVGTAKFEGKPHTIRASGGKGALKAKSTIGFFALYPESEKNDDQYDKIHSSVVALE